MKTEPDGGHDEDLRARAVRMLEAPQEDFGPVTREKFRALIHELQVHEAELNMQNEELRRTQLELAVSRDRLLDLFEFAPVAYLMIDQDGRVGEANFAAATLLGVDRRLLAGAVLTKFVHPRSRDTVNTHIQDAFASQSRVIAEVDLFRPDGTEVFVRMKSMARGYAGERLCRTAVIDISERRQAERRLAESEERLRYSLRASAAGVWDWNLRTGRVVWSPENYEVFDMDPETVPELTYAIWESRVHPDDLPAANAAVRDALEGRSKEFRSEFRVVTRNRETRWVLGLGRVERDAAGEPVRMSGLNVDLSERKSAEEARRESEERLRLATSAAELGVFEWSVASDTTIWENDRMYEILGRTREEGTIGRARFYESVLDPRDQPAFETALQDSMATGKRFFAQCRIRRMNDGESRWVAFSGRFMFGPDGTPVRLICILADITLRIEAESALRESEHRFRVMADHVPLIVWVHGPVGQQLFVNRTFGEFFGVGAGDVLGLRWKDLLHPEDADRYGNEFTLAIQEQRPFHADVRVRRFDGEWRWVESWGTPRFDSDGTFLGHVGTSVDITERKVAENALRSLNETLDRRVAEQTGALSESEARLRLLTGKLRDAVWLQEGDSLRISYCNPAFRALFGTSEGWKNAPWDLVTHVHEEDRAQVKAEFRRLWSGKSLELECRLTSPGPELRWVRCRVYPVMEGARTVRRVVGIAEDISERKAAETELHRLGSEVGQAAEDERRRIAREIHDSLGGRLATIGLRHGMLMEQIREGQMPGADEAGIVEEMIGDAVREARHLGEGLSPVGEHPEDLAEALANLAAKVRVNLRLDCQFLCPGPTPIHDPRVANELFRIAQEAANNAVKHSGATRLTIRLGLEDQAVVLAVQDNGCGIGHSIPRKEGGGQGTRIMEYRAASVGGALKIASRKARGTTVTCRVPLSKP